MADDSLNIIYPMDFDRYSGPKGMKPYIPEDLTEHQHFLLEDLKVNNVRNNQKYLDSHPEVRAIVALIFRMIMKRRPRTAKPKFYEIIAQRFFVDKSLFDLRQEIDEYLAERRLIYAKKSDLTMFTPFKHHHHHPPTVKKVVVAPVPQEEVKQYVETDWAVCHQIMDDILNSIDYDKEPERKRESLTSVESDYEIAPEVYASEASLTSVMHELERRTENKSSTDSSQDDDLDLKQMF